MQTLVYTDILSYKIQKKEGALPELGLLQKCEHDPNVYSTQTSPVADTWIRYAPSTCNAASHWRLHQTASQRVPEGGASS